MTLSEFKREYHPTNGSLAFAQLIVDELDHSEVELRKHAQEYLTAARALHKTATALGVEVF